MNFEEIYYYYMDTMSKIANAAAITAATAIVVGLVLAFPVAAVLDLTNWIKRKL